VGHLPGGHAAFIDLDCGVRYGIIGEPVPAEESGSADRGEVPEQARKVLAENLHGSFLVFRDKVQEDLKLTDEQKEKLEQHVKELAMEFFQKMEDLERLKSEDRDKERGAYRQKAQEQLAAILKDTKLKEHQRKRLRQLELQRDGAFVLLHGDVEIGKDLLITGEQRQQFMAVVQAMQKRIEPLMKEAQSGGDPHEIWPKILKVRKEHEGKLEALLTDAQKKQWKEMLGKPLNLGD
jgi:hypothetical protein